MLFKYVSYYNLVCNIMPLLFIILTTDYGNSFLFQLISLPTLLRVVTVMKIYIRVLTGKYFPVEVQPNDSILAIKNQIKDLEGIAVHSQRLVFNNTELKDNRRVIEYDIEEESYVLLIVRIRGGGKSVTE